MEPGEIVCSMVVMAFLWATSIAVVWARMAEGEREAVRKAKQSGFEAGKEEYLERCLELAERVNKLEEELERERGRRIRMECDLEGAMADAKTLKEWAALSEILQGEEVVPERFLQEGSVPITLDVEGYDKLVDSSNQERLDKLKDSYAARYAGGRL
ncbi:MAG: hypothetical protein AAFX99_19165 [Myxococcota bacterium]